MMLAYSSRSGAKLYSPAFLPSAIVTSSVRGGCSEEIVTFMWF